MRLLTLHLRDYRNYARLHVEFPPGIIVLAGPNGAGKSNLLEAIHYLSYLRSFRAAHDREVVRFGSPLALIEAQLADNASRPFDARLVLRSGQRYLRLNGSDVTRFQDFIGKLHSQFFFPGDLSLLTGDPAQRREVLDLELLRLKPQLTAVYAQFAKALRERNRVLKLLYPPVGRPVRRGTVGGGLAPPRSQPAGLAGKVDPAAGAAGGRAQGSPLRHAPTELQKALQVYTAQLVAARTQVLHERRGLVTVLQERFGPLYSGLAPEGGETVALRYLSAVELKRDDAIAASYRRLLDGAAEKEAQLRYTTVGPQRDDLGFVLDGKHDLRRYGSQGQLRSAVLAFRLALCELSRQRLSDDPILLLDDALSEMDDRRKRALLGLLAHRTQVFITSASEREVELIAPLATAVYRVEDGKVKREK